MSALTPYEFTKKQKTPQGEKIRCRWCDLAETCPARARKEKYEESGWTTRCLITPNRPGKKKSTR